MLNFLTSLSSSTWLYIALSVVALFFIRLIWLARGRWLLSTSMGARERFDLQVTVGAVGLLVTLVLMLFVFIRSQRSSGPEILAQGTSTITPTPSVTHTPPPTAVVVLRTSVLVATATPSPTATPAATASPTPTETVIAPPTETPTTVPIPTETPTPAPPPTQPPPTPDLSQGQPPNCPLEGARIVRPGDGAQVNGVIDIFGAAVIENFDYYKFEFRVPGQEWSYIQHSENLVVEGLLGQWDTNLAPTGEYEFRLVVVDINGNFPEPCTIRLAVNHS